MPQATKKHEPTICQSAMARSSYYHRTEPPNNEPERDIGVKIKAMLDKRGCSYVPSVAPVYLKFFIMINNVNKLECWLAEGNNEKLGIVIVKDNNSCNI